MADLAAINNITPPRVPFIDERSGQISREWYLFLFSQFSQSRVLTIDTNANQTAIQVLTINLQATQAELDATQGELDAVQTEVDLLATELQGSTLGPTYTPQLPRLRYGSFYDTTDQTAAAINTAYGMTFNTTDITNGVYIGSPTSRVYVDTVNVYNIQFSAQLINTAGGAHNVWIWLRKNGTDIPNSATVLRIEGNNTEAVAAWNFLLPMNAGDYFELMWEVSDLSVTLHADPATAVHPAIPSIILTVTDNISS